MPKASSLYLRTGITHLLPEKRNKAITPKKRQALKCIWSYKWHTYESMLCFIKWLVSEILLLFKCFSVILHFSLIPFQKVIKYIFNQASYVNPRLTSGDVLCNRRLRLSEMFLYIIPGSCILVFEFSGIGS